MTVEIRAARTEDLKHILGLLPQLATESREPYEVPQDEAAAAFARINATDGHTLLVAALDGRIVGSLHLVIVPNLTHGARPWAIVENLVVDESHRRSGIGQRLLGDAVRRARDDGCYKVQLLSRTERAGAHEFYGAVGFEPAAVGFRLYFDP